MNAYIINDGELYHHGIKGQRWGVRRFQNEDGTLTDAGVKRYIDSRSGKLTRKGEKRLKEVGEDSIEGKHIREAKRQVDIKNNWEKSFVKADLLMDSEIDRLNAKYKNDFKNPKFTKEVVTTWQKLYSNQLIKDFGPDVISNGKKWVEKVPLYEVEFFEED
jgi:hypothetical protein